MRLAPGQLSFDTQGGHVIEVGLLGCAAIEVRHAGDNKAAGAARAGGGACVVVGEFADFIGRLVRFNSQLVYLGLRSAVIRNLVARKAQELDEGAFDLRIG